VGSTTTDRDDTVQFRLRVNQKGSWQSWSRIVNSNNGQAPSNVAYQGYPVFFNPDVTNPGDDDIILNFDLMSFSNLDDPASWILLDETIIDEVYVWGGALNTANSFEKDTEGWNFAGHILPYDYPAESHPGGYLGLNAVGSSNAFSFWESPGMILPSGIWYRARFDVSSSCPDPDKAVQFRCRINQKGSWQAWERIVNSNNGQAPAMGEWLPYEVIINPIVTDISDSQVVASFDIMSFDANDNVFSFIYLGNFSLDQIGINP
jgi:hypothetical protein